jgi:hypothetical protein
MSDTDTPHLTGPIEGDGVSYQGIAWFVVILAATTLFCMAVVWGLFRAMEYRTTRAEAQPAPLAVPMGERGLPPGPNLLTDEPGNLRTFRQREDAALTSYGWVDESTGVVRVPIDRAKALVLERGLPIRP